MSLLQLLQNEPTLQSSDNSGGFGGILSVVESACEECLFGVAVATDHIGVPIPTSVFSSILGMYGALPLATKSSSVSAYGAISTRIVRNTNIHDVVLPTTPSHFTKQESNEGPSSSSLDVFRSYIDTMSSSSGRSCAVGGSSGGSSTAVDPWALAWVRKYLSEPVASLFLQTPTPNHNTNNLTAQRQTARTLECILRAGKHMRTFNTALLLLSMDCGGVGVHTTPSTTTNTMRKVLNELHNGHTTNITTPSSSFVSSMSLLLDVKSVLTYSIEVCGRACK